MTSQTFVVEMAVLLLFAFVLGGLVGFWARRWFMPPAVRKMSESTSEDANTPVPDKRANSAGGSVPDVAAQIHDFQTATAEPIAVADTPEAPPAKTKPAKTSRKPKRAAAPAVPAPEASDEAVDGKPVLLAEARNGRPDDLKKIKGIGPKIETLLHGLGVYHYDQIAAWGSAEIAWVDDKLSFRGRIDREGWVSQAQALVNAGS